MYVNFFQHFLYHDASCEDKDQQCPLGSALQTLSSAATSYQDLTQKRILGSQNGTIAVPGVAKRVGICRTVISDASNTSTLGVLQLLNTELDETPLINEIDNEAKETFCALLWMSSTGFPLPLFGTTTERGPLQCC